MSETNTKKTLEQLIQENNELARERGCEMWLHLERSALLQKYMQEQYVRFVEEKLSDPEVLAALGVQAKP